VCGHQATNAFVGKQPADKSNRDRLRRLSDRRELVGFDARSADCEYAFVRDAKTFNRGTIVGVLFLF